jgi:V8-like Glu-specific endopeptidase
MDNVRTSPYEFSVEELDMELIVRGAQVPDEKRFKFKDNMDAFERDCIMGQVKELYDAAKSWSPNEALRDISTEDLVKILLFKTGKIEINNERGIWGKDKRLDFFEIEDDRIRKNADCTTAILFKESLIESGKEFSLIKVKNYGKNYNLSDYESFYNQSMVSGRVCTGFLVEEDIVATAGHCSNNGKVEDLRFVFGFRMLDSSTPALRIPNSKIYKGVKLLHTAYDRRCIGSDWALVQLDRKVEGQRIAKISGSDVLSEQPVYVLGHPCGLPLKYAPGANVHDVKDESFGANLDIYMGNSGSPIFNSQTHEVIGIVVHGDNRDFRWTGSGWVSVIYPNPEFHSQGAKCIKVSQFIGKVKG